MRVKKFKTQYNVDEFEKVLPEIDNTSLVEKAGYIPAKVRIENLINAGQRLSDYRKAQYSYPSGEFDEDNVEIDPTLKGSYDMADAFQDIEGIKSRKKTNAVQSPVEHDDTEDTEDPQDSKESTSGDAQK